MTLSKQHEISKEANEKSSKEEGEVGEGRGRVSDFLHSGETRGPLAPGEGLFISCYSGSPVGIRL